MGHIGDTLKEARLAKGLSIEDIETATSIRKTYLSAIENGDFDKTPGTVFTKGIIRTYGNYLGLNGAELVNIYKAEIQKLPPTFTPEPVRKPEKIHLAPKIKPQKVSSHSTPTYLLFLALTLFVAGIIAFMLNSSTTVAPNETNQSNANNTATNTVAATPTWDGVNVTIKCNDRCWVEAKADGAAVFEALMNKGDEKTLKAKDLLVIKYGNISVMDISFNGQALPKENVPEVVIREYKK